MSGNPVAMRRARRLLRWYPKSWRDRYGEEFADHLEQEFADRPIDLPRAYNIAYKGVVARVGDIGLAYSTLNAERRNRASVGTTVVPMIFVAVLALNFWSRAMGLWSGRRYHPIPVSLTTGILTIAEGLILILLAAIIGLIVIGAIRDLRHHRARPLVGPLVLAAGSGAFLLYCLRWVPQELYRYAHGVNGRPGIGLSQPGRALAALGQTAWDTTQSWVAPWNMSSQNSTSFKVETFLFPVALLFFGLAIALLVRRIQLNQGMVRLIVGAVTLLGTLTGVFLVTYVMWLIFGGPSGNELFWPEGSRAGDIYLVLLLLITVMIGRTRWVARRHERTATLSPTAK